MSSGENEHIDPNRIEDITVEEVKSCTLFSHFTDEQAMEVIETIKQFSLIAYNLFQSNATVQKKD